MSSCSCSCSCSASTSTPTSTSLNFRCWVCVDQGMEAMLASIVVAFVLVTALACGDGTKSDPATPSAATPVAEPALTQAPVATAPTIPPEPKPAAVPEPVAAPKAAAKPCSQPPPPVPNNPPAAESFDVTAERIAAGAERRYNINTISVASRSEGGTHEVSIRGIDKCGLWLVTLYTGTDMGGDADVQRTTFRAIPKTKRGYLVTEHGAKLLITVRKGGAITAKLLKTIPEYDGE